MRKWILGLVLILTLSSFPAFSANPPKPGSVCSKQGITKTYKGKKYTCIKSGKKLLWNKGVAVKTAVPQVTSTPTPTSTFNPIPDPIPTTYPSANPTTSSNPTPISERSKSPGERAADEVTKEFNSHTSKSDKLVIVFSPTINRNSLEVKQNIEDTHKSIAYWESLGVRFDQDITLIFATEKDKDWWKDYKLRLGSSEHELDRSTFANYLTQPFMGYVGIGRGGGKSSSSIHIFLFLASNLERRSDLYWARTMASHEFAHVVQFLILEEAADYQAFEKQACWFIEGLARFYERATQYSTLYEDQFTYQEMKERQLTYFDYIIPRETEYKQVKDWSLDTYLEFLTNTQDRNASDVCKKTGYGYSIGWPLSEKFYIDFGPSSFVELLKDLKQSGDWNIAFQRTTGISHYEWLRNSAIPYLIGTAP